MKVILSWVAMVWLLSGRPYIEKLLDQGICLHHWTIVHFIQEEFTYRAAWSAYRREYGRY